MSHNKTGDHTGSGHHTEESNNSAGKATSASTGGHPLTPKTTQAPQGGGAVDDAKKDFHDTGDSLSKAGGAISNFASGKANMVDTAMAVKGAFDAVSGLSGKVSSSLMMPVMKALGPLKGKAILPAAKQMDPVMGIDVHMVTIPPSPAPVPLPHPYIGMLFNTKDFVSCLINTFKKDVLDAVPTPAEGDTSNMASLANNKEAIMGIAMGLASMGASIKFGDFIPRAVCGTPTKNIPHIPMGAGFHPAFAAAVAKNDGKAFLGSLFVAADGDPMVGSFHLNYDCWDIGVIDLFKSQRGGGKIKEPEEPETQAELFVPSGVITPIPLGRPVLVNSIPTPINPLALLDKLFKAGLSKLKSAAKKGVEKGLEKLHGKVGCGTLTAVSKWIGTGQSHPVDVAGGNFYTDNVDFRLPGPIPLIWERTWYSYSSYKGPLGHGWHHRYDMALAIDAESAMAILRMGDGRVAIFELSALGSMGVYNRSVKLTLHLHPEGYYYASDRNALLYRFSKEKFRNSFNNTETFLLQSVANQNGFAIRFTYNYKCALTQITDSAGRILTFKSDDQGRIIAIHAPHPSLPGATFAIARYSYSDEGDMLSHADALDQPMRFEYVNHLMIKEVWRNGSAWNFRYNKSAGIDAKCIEVWGDRNLLHYKFDYTDPQCTLVTNSLGDQKRFYHRNGIVIKYVDPLGHEWEYHYNRFNELEWEADPLGNQQSYTYDDRGNSATTTDPEGGFSHTEHLNPFFPHFPTAATDAAGGKWKWGYDERGNLIERVNPLGAKTVYEYTDGLLSMIVNAAGAVSLIRHDNDGNQITIESDDGAISQYIYDKLGNRIGIVNPKGKKQDRLYDLNGRVSEIRDFDGNDIRFEYDAIDNITLYQDKQREVRYAYTGLWKLTSRTEAGSTIYFTYDTEEQLRKVLNEHGLSYTFDLDAAGNVIAEKDFNETVRRYEHNPAGWITEIIRPGGKLTRYKHDACGRATDVAYSDGKKEQYTYRADGKIVKALNESILVTFERDVLGSILKESVGDEVISSEYDNLGNRLSIISSLGANIVRQYNGMGDVLSMDANGWQARLEYDKLGKETKRSMPGDLTSRWLRDDIGRPIMHMVGNTSGSAFNNSKSRQYLWDVNDRLQEIKEDRDSIKFEYDLKNNLSATIYADGGVQLRNADAVGNLYKTAARKDRVYANGGRLKKDGNWDYKYDAEGNLVEKKQVGGDAWFYEWNDAGMLTKVIRPDKEEVTFSYDAFGRRLWKKFKNTITKFAWDGNTILHEWKEHAVTKEKISNTSVGEDGIITWFFETDKFSPAAKIKGNKKYSIVTDHLGTPTQMYTEDGSLFWDCVLDSYGKVKLEKGEIGSCPFRYQGQYEDRETGLYYNRFRYYSPDEGMYISSDPIGLRGGFELYRYIDDPNISIDPYGLSGTRPTRTVNGTEIVGTGQTTGGKGHADISNQTADNMAQTGEYKKIGVNVAVSTVTGVSTDPKRRPDVTGVRHDGTVDIVEVPSPSDDPNKLKEKGADTLKQLGKRAGTYTATAKTSK